MGKKDKSVAAASSGATVTLHDGTTAPLTSGSFGYFVKNPCYLRCSEGFMASMKLYELTDSEPFGSAGNLTLPRKMQLSAGHMEVGIQNGVYFVKDTSKVGTYIQIGAGKKKSERVELKKGMQFAVGGVWLKVVNIEGATAANIAAAASGDAPKKEKSKKSKDEDLDSDEEYADDSDDDKGGGGGAGDASKPAKLVLAGVDKKLKIKASFYETGYIGSDKDKCARLVIKKDRAISRKVDPVHSKIIFEDGRYYLEDAGSVHGTWVGVGKKSYFQLNQGDLLMLGRVRCKVTYTAMAFRPLQGFIDKLMGDMGTKDYKVTFSSPTADVQTRLNATKSGGL